MSNPTGSTSAQASSAEETRSDTESMPLVPIVIDLGKTRRKHIKALKRGEGKLIDEVQQAVDLVRHQFGDEAEERTILPVVIVYRKKERKRKSFFPFYG